MGNKLDFNTCVDILNLDSKKEEYKSLLENSLFYYCCGNDPSPIIAFKDNYPIYIYVDRKNLSEPLYCKLLKKHYKLNNKQEIQKLNATLTEWIHDQKNFYLLFIQNDARDIYKTLYANHEILPKCICNYRYEMANRSIIETAENQVLYILGHCFNKEYAIINEYDYYGDYSFNQEIKISLFKKMY